jgi:hypothetical protein
MTGNIHMLPKGRKLIDHNSTLRRLLQSSAKNAPKKVKKPRASTGTIDSEAAVKSEVNDEYVCPIITEACS